ncbi:MAG TPA: SpoIID/LytB domain-containing protein [Pyrinomonadaceae bacterium]|nr:SpoIID/LytB domain-containing protein [Pyrinomonadaceae bacterium]
MQSRRSLVEVLPTPRAPVRPSRWPFLTVGLLLVAIWVAIVVWSTAIRSTRQYSLAGTASDAATADALDGRLQRAAILALGERRGTVIVMDPQTGRVRAVVNRELAFEENLPPGSTIKPFTALAALRSGVINEDSRTLCREKYSHEEFHTTCAHPRDLPPLNPTDAIAYSCNYYFGKVGESLGEADFDATLDQFGFGKASGINAARESQGLLRRNQWHTQNAIGEGDYLRATPIQLIDAYATLVNGGRLFTPRIAPPAGFVPEVRANVAINREHRSLILKGMRGAVRYGTAETATLYSLPAYVFGKTGTATEINGYRSQGWFVGFASPLDDQAGDEAEFAPEKVKLAVLVFLARAHGSEAAEAARPIFEEYARFVETEGHGDADTPRHGDEEATTQKALETIDGDSPRLPVTASPRPATEASPRPASEVRVHLVHENVTVTLPLEDYVRGVVAAEGSLEREPEALKALAIASRTYVLKNIGRHARDGYDFCTTTHCQRFRLTDSSAKISAAVDEAVDATRGEVLLDGNSELAEAYFSASCGGATANLATLWGGNAPAYLRGVRDEYCPSEAHHQWTDVIPQAQLLKALRSDPRTDVGERLANISVLRSDASGRAELLAIEGNRRVTIRGWDFKIIVGRALGWQLLKSSRFEISRSGSNFIFRGSGFGHGLGLCQEGAHVMAERGASYRQILAKYFPTTRLASRNPSADLIWNRKPQLSGGRRPDGALARLSSNSSPGLNSSQSNHAGKVVRQTLRSEAVSVNYPNTIDEREIEELLSLLQSSRRSLVARATAAGVKTQFPALEIYINETTGDFVGRTGLPIWAAAATRDNKIEIQPLATLKRRRILETTLRHELVHTMIDAISHERAPRWLAEGFALYLAGEGPLVARYEPRRRMTTAEIDKQLGYSQWTMSADDMRIVYAAAYGEVRRLIKSEGEARIWRRLAH